MAEFSQKEWEELHQRTLSQDHYVRRSAARSFGWAFPSLPDVYKTQAWQDLIRLTADQYSDVRWGAAESLGSAFPSLPDVYKTQAWQDLHRLTADQDSDVRWGAAESLGSAFSSVPDGFKNQAWQDLHRLTADQDSDVRRVAARSLGSAFPSLPDVYKTQAWQDLIRLTADQDSDVRRVAARSLGSAFPSLPDVYKTQAWRDLHRLTADQYSDVRWGAAESLGSAFSSVPDGFKNQAWRDLIRLTADQYSDVRWVAAESLGSAFSSVPDGFKNQAWRDLIRLTADQYSDVRWVAAESLGSAFPSLPDVYKNQACQDLIRLTADQYSAVRRVAAESLGSAFPSLPDVYKNQACQDLIRLTADQDSDVRRVAARSLGSAFPSIPDVYKNQACQDLHRLTADQDSDVRWGVAESLGSAFSSVPDGFKNQAWQDLHRLTADRDSDVRMYAYHSLGRACVFKATAAAEDKAFQGNLEKAIEFFERSSQEAKYYNPAKFCLPFYRSFLAVTFQEVGSREQVNRYLAEAKGAVAGSKSRKLLLQAVENLSLALQEAHQARGRLESQAVLAACRLYCEKTAELLDETDGMAPGASGIVRRGIPIINQQIKEILKEIEEKAAKFCQASRDTPLEVFGRSTFKRSRNLVAVESQKEAELVLKSLLENVLDYCSSLPSGVGDPVCRQLKRAEKGRPMDQGMAISSAIAAWTTYVQDLKENADKTQKIMARLNEIDFRILKLGQLSSRVAINSSETVALLKSLKEQLDKTPELGPSLEHLHSNPDKLDPSLQKRLVETDQEMGKIVEGLDKILKQMPELSNKSDLSLKVEELKKELKEPMFWKVADRASIVASLIGIILTML